MPTSGKEPGCFDIAYMAAVLGSGLVAICWGLWLLFGYLAAKWSTQDWLVAGFLLQLYLAIVWREWRDNPNGPARLRGWLMAIYLASVSGWCVLYVGFVVDMLYFSHDSPEIPAWLASHYLGAKEYLRRHASFGWLALVLPASILAAGASLKLRAKPNGPLLIGPWDSADPAFMERIAAARQVAERRLRLVQVGWWIAAVVTLWPVFIALPIHLVASWVRGGMPDNWWWAVEAIGSSAATLIAILLIVYERRMQERRRREAIDKLYRRRWKLPPKVQAEIERARLRMNSGGTTPLSKPPHSP